MCVFLALSICLLKLIRQKNESQRRLGFAIKLGVADHLARQHSVKVGPRR